MRAAPIPGAKERLQELKQRGYRYVLPSYSHLLVHCALSSRLIIITARSEKQREGTEDWLELYLPDIFDELHFTGAFQHLDPTPEEQHGHAARKAVLSHHKRTKAEVVHRTNALLLIDDSAENALEASRASPPVKVLLFGRYTWNEVLLRPEEADEVDGMKYVDWLEKGLMGEVEARRTRRLQEGWLPDHVERVGDWDQVVARLERWEKAGRPALV